METPIRMDFSEHARATSDKNASEFETTNHENDSTFNNSLSSSCELIDTSIEYAEINKKTMASKLDLVISLMREVELKEKAAEEAKEEAATSGLDILAKVDELKQAQQIAKEANDMHAREVYAKNASLAIELKELQRRASDVVKEGGRFLKVFDEMQRALEMRLASAVREKKLADKEKIEKESSAKEALAFEESQMLKHEEESRKLKEAAIKNSMLQEFLIDRGLVVDKLQKYVSDKYHDMKLLKGSSDPPDVCLSELTLSSRRSSIEAPKEPADEHAQFVEQTVVPEKEWLFNIPVLQEYVSDKFHDMKLLKVSPDPPDVCLSEVSLHSQRSSIEAPKEPADEHAQFVEQTVLPENELLSNIPVLQEYASDKYHDTKLLKEPSDPPDARRSELSLSSRRSSVETPKERADEHAQFVEQTVLPENEKESIEVENAPVVGGINEGGHPVLTNGAAAASAQTFGEQVAFKFTVNLKEGLDRKWIKLKKKGPARRRILSAVNGI